MAITTSIYQWTNVGWLTLDLAGPRLKKILQLHSAKLNELLRHQDKAHISQESHHTIKSKTLSHLSNRIIDRFQKIQKPTAISARSDVHMVSVEEEELQRQLAECTLNKSWVFSVVGLAISVPLGLKFKSYNPVVYCGLTGTMLDLLNGMLVILLAPCLMRCCLPGAIVLLLE